MNIVDNLIKLYTFVITLSAEKYVNLILLSLVIFLGVRDYNKDERIEAMVIKENANTTDCAGKISECDRRLIMQSEAYQRVHNDYRDRVEADNLARIKRWQESTAESDARLRAYENMERQTKSNLEEIKLLIK